MKLEESKRQEYSYIGKEECGCVVAGVVDMSDNEKFKRQVARDVADMIKQGLIVERVKTAEVVFNFKCDHQPAAPEPAQPTLF